MNNRKFTYFSLIITFILLVTTIGLTQAGASNQPIESPVQGVAAAIKGAPLGGPFIIGDFLDQNVDARDPSITYNSQRQEYLVVWWNDRPGCDDIFGRRVSADGSLIGLRFPIANGCPGERSYPDVTYNSLRHEYLVVWNYAATDTNPPFCIQGQRMSGTGEHLGGVFNITDCSSTAYYAFYPAAGYAGTSDKYEVVWSGRAASASSLNVEGMTLSSIGALIGTSVMIAQGDADWSYEDPDLAYNVSQNGYLVVYHRRGWVAPLGLAIYAHLVHGDGAPTGSPIEIERLVGNNMYPAVAAMPSAFTKGQFLVVWESWYDPSDRDILGRLINGDGIAYSDTFTVLGGPDDEASPNVAANDATQQYLVTWTHFSAPPLLTSDLFGMIIHTDGSHPRGWIGLGGMFADHSAPASGAHGDFLTTFDDQPFILNRVVMGRFWCNRIYLPLVAGSEALN
jgi:hypothetical protein